MENTIFSKLLDKHIIKVKDSSFFNCPILAVEIHDIDTRIEKEAPKIIEAIYSLIRMIGFNNNYQIKNWSSILNIQNAPSTYTVYYNEVGTTPNPPYNEGYGYSFRFKFSPLLDVSVYDLSKQLDLLSDKIEHFIDVTLQPKRELNKVKYKRLLKWQNGVLLFNEAYELASRERFDSALLLLLTILESLFIESSEKNKSVILVKELAKFFTDQSRNDMIAKSITILYRKRNAFVHEGKRLDTYQYYKSINDINGLITGLEPLKFVNGLREDHDLRHLHVLFTVCKDILLNYCFDVL